MSLSSSLLSNARALNVHSRAIEIAGQNIRNANNPEYARQRVELSQEKSFIGAQGVESLGAKIQSIQHFRDSLLDKQLMQSISLKAFDEIRLQGYQNLEYTLGESVKGTQVEGQIGEINPASITGLRESLSAFFRALGELSNNPSDLALKTNLLTVAQVTLDQFHALDDRLKLIEENSLDEIQLKLPFANESLRKIAELNEEINRIEHKGFGQALELRDLRQKELENLAQYVDFTTETIMSENQQETFVLKVHSERGFETLVDGWNVKQTLTFDATEEKFKIGDKEALLGSGKLKGLLLIKQEGTVSLKNDIDLLAKILVKEVNKAYNPNSDTGKDFFEGTETEANTLKLADGLTPSTLRTSLSGNAGDNALIKSMIELQKTPVTFDDGSENTLSDFYREKVIVFGNKVKSTEASLNGQTLAHQFLETQRQSYGGVSIDEEVIDLMRFQKAFQGTAKVMVAIDEMLEIVVSGFRR